MTITNFYKVTFVRLLIGIILSLGLLSTIKADTQQKPIVYVSIPPLAYFVDRIGGENFDCRILIGPGMSPITYEATQKTLVALSEAEVLFTVAVPFEKQLVKKIKDSFKTLNIVNTQQGIALDHQAHHHDEIESDETAENIDPHSWLDPRLAKIMAQNIYNELARINPEDNSYKLKFEQLSADLDSLYSDLSRQLLPLKGTSFYTFHPAFGYFARAFGLQQKSIETGGKEPSARQMAEIIETARENNIRVLFVQPQFSKKTAQSVADAIGARLVPIDPLAEDYINNLKEIAAQLISAHGKSNE